jgi:hypothetical protein
MGEDDLLINLESKLNFALSTDVKDDTAAAVAKTAVIKNI